MIAAAKRAEAFAPTLNEYRPARRFPINPIPMELMMETNTTTPPRGATTRDLVDIDEALTVIGNGVDAIYMAAHALNDFEREAIQMVTTECERRITAVQKRLRGLLGAKSHG